jgi:hypothetical protein
MLNDVTNPNLSSNPTSWSVAAIVPAYNEDEYIHNVLEILHQSDALNEIIVVNDGSTDKTENIANQMAQVDPRIRVICHDLNKGKGQAVLTGWHSTHAPILVIFDADLIKLNVHHIQTLIQPVLEDFVDMSVGIFRGGHITTDFAHLATPWLSGQRCIRAELLKSISQKAAEGYGLETAITIASKQNQWRVCKVILRGVTHPHSEFHRGIYKGIINRVRIYTEILRAWWIAIHEGHSKHSSRYRSSSDYENI